MFVKFIDSKTIVRASRVVLDNGKYYANPSEKTLKKLGYKELIENEQPQIEGNQYIEPYYTETEQNVINSWEVITNPTQEEVHDEPEA